MYGAVQGIGNLDVDTMDIYQVAKRKGFRIIQKCNELLVTRSCKKLNFGHELFSLNNLSKMQTPQSK